MLHEGHRDKQAQGFKIISVGRVAQGGDYKLVERKMVVLYSPKCALMRQGNGPCWTRIRPGPVTDKDRSRKDDHGGKTRAIGRCINTNWQFG